MAGSALSGVDLAVSESDSELQKQLMAMKSDAPFRDAKSKLLEIRSRLAKQNAGKTDMREERKRKKKQEQGSDGHAWTVVR